MTLPDSISVDPDEWHRQLYEEALGEEDRESVREFITGQLTARAETLIEEAIYQQYQASKNDD